MASYDGAALDSEKYAGHVTDDTNAPPSLYHIDPVVEKRVLRKLDTRLVTLVSAFYLLVCIRCILASQSPVFPWVLTHYTGIS